MCTWCIESFTNLDIIVNRQGGTQVDVWGSIPPSATSLLSLFGWDVKLRSSLSTHASYQTRTIKIVTFCCIGQWGPATHRYPAHGALYKHWVACCASPVSLKKKKLMYRPELAIPEHLFYRCKNVWPSKNTKIRLLNNKVKAVFLYKAVTWRMKVATNKKIQNLTNNCMRKILWIRWPDFNDHLQQGTVAAY